MNPCKRWNLIRVSLEHTTLPLLVSRSTDWDNGAFDTNLFQNNIFNSMNVRKLLKKEKVTQIKSEIQSVWMSNTRLYRY